METLNDEQVQARIDAFITKKHVQYPELALRGREKRAKTIGYLLADKFAKLVENSRYAKLAH